MTATTQPPARWLLALTVFVVAIFTVGRFALAATLDLRSDEAYYWTWSHQNVMSFLDHPPMVAWFERFGQLIFGDNLLGARFSQLLALPLIQLLLGDIARRRTQSWNAALFMVLALECSPYYSVNVVVIEPSVPLLLFVSLVLWALSRLEQSADARWWLLAGVAAGLAAASKYLVILLAPALLLFLLLLPKQARGLNTPWPWLGAVAAAVVLSPVLVWNIQHDWISVTFQSSRLGSGQGLGVIHLLYFLLLDLGGVGLVLALAVLVRTPVLGVRAILTRRPFEALIAAAFVVPLGFFLVRSLSFQINMSWTYFVWPIGILGLVLALPWTTWTRWRAALLAGVMATGLPIGLALVCHGTIDSSAWLNGIGDPLGMDAGYDDLSERVLTEANAAGATWIATTEYRTYANLLWHIGDRIMVVQVNERARFLDFAMPDSARLAGRALYVHAGAPPALLDGQAFGAHQELPIVWRGTNVGTMQADVLDGYTPDLSPAPGAPAFVANPNAQ